MEEERESLEGTEEEKVKRRQEKDSVWVKGKREKEMASKISMGPKFSAFSILNTLGVVLTAISPVGKTSEQFRDLQMGLQRLQMRRYLSVPEPK